MDPMKGLVKPLHVQVAEALEPWIETFLGMGPQNIGSCADDGALPSPIVPLVWLSKIPLRSDHSCSYMEDGDPCRCPPFYYRVIPRYDTDWAVTGPLMERHRLTLTMRGSWWLARRAEDEITPVTAGATPLVAVCHLLVRLYGRSTRQSRVDYWIER